MSLCRGKSKGRLCLPFHFTTVVVLLRIGPKGVPPLPPGLCSLLRMCYLCHRDSIYGSHRRLNCVKTGREWVFSYNTLPIKPPLFGVVKKMGTTKKFL